MYYLKISKKRIVFQTQRFNIEEESLDGAVVLAVIETDQIIQVKQFRPAPG